MVDNCITSLAFVDWGILFRCKIAFFVFANTYLSLRASLFTS